MELRLCAGALGLGFYGFKAFRIRVQGCRLTACGGKLSDRQGLNSSKIRHPFFVVGLIIHFPNWGRVYAISGTGMKHQNGRSQSSLVQLSGHRR